MVLGNYFTEAIVGDDDTLLVRSVNTLEDFSYSYSKKIKKTYLTCWITLSVRHFIKLLANPGY